MLPAIASALIGAAGSALGTGAQMLYNSREAQKTRDYEERMSSTAYQRAVKDMQAAGLNVGLMYGNGANPASTPSGATATYSGNPVQDAINLSFAREQLRGLKLDNESKETNIEYQKLINQYYPSVTEKGLEEVASRIGVNLSTVPLNEAKTASEKVNAAISRIEMKHRDRILSAQRQLMNAQAKDSLSSADLKAVQALVSQVELEFMNTYHMKMGTSDALMTALAVGELLGIDMDKFGNQLGDILRHPGSHLIRNWQNNHRPRPYSPNPSHGGAGR